MLLMKSILGEETMFGKIASSLTGLMVLYAMFEQYCPFEIKFEKYFGQFMNLFNPYIDIKFYEYTGHVYDEFERSKTYGSIEKYLREISSTRARKLRADMITENGSGMVLSMDDYDEIQDEFQGIKLRWSSSTTCPRTQKEESRRFYKLSFHKKHRDLVTDCYLAHVLREGKVMEAKIRSRKLYTNVVGAQYYGSRTTLWCHVAFDHPASFDTIAMESNKKEEIIDDLITFSKAKDYYARIGRTWKRGYLLYGPPGTGKSTMIASMARLLDYDIYDLELTAVRDNTELRKLLIETTSKSIIVIEDIDCSVNLTGQRKKEKKKKKKSDDEDEEEDEEEEEEEEDKNKEKANRVTLSGLLNFIDGLWSAIGSERVIVFTTNHVDKLDPALIRSGRMDKHIELSYCCFETFKVLAKNYLEIESHSLFTTIAKLLDETKVTPADVAENLMPKNLKADVDTCLGNLIKAIEKSNEEKRLKEEKSLKEQKKKVKWKRFGKN